ncbi:MAG: RNA polymerase sigma factor [Bacteroidales bacterium]|nr:RNA polymerase sigma factor [Bacteroidales bacterium]
MAEDVALISKLAEKELIDKCCENDRKSQKTLYLRYCDAMFSTAYRMMNNREDAGDVLQEAFIQVFRDIRDFQGRSTLGAWIKTIVVRCALKRLKKERFTVEFNEDIHDFAVYLPDSITGEYLEKAILSLPEGYRTVFLLIEVEGYSHHEAADMLGISPGTSKSQLFHARKRLQEIINKIDGLIR